MSWLTKEWKKIDIDPLYRVAWLRCPKGEKEPIAWTPKDRDHEREYSEEDRVLIRRTIEEWTKAKRIEILCTPYALSDAHAFRNFLHIVKPDGKKPRIVLDGRASNVYIDKGEVQLPSVKVIRQFICSLRNVVKLEDIRIAKIDLSAGFHQMPAAMDSRHTFVFESVIYHFLVLPFGPRDGPSAFQRCTSALGAHLQSKFHIYVFVYLDDFVMISTRKDTASTREIMDHMKTFGVIPNYEKSSEWSTSVEVLGIVFDLKDETLEISTKKREDLKNRCWSIIQSPMMTSRSVACVCGRAIATAIAFPILNLLARPLFEDLNIALQKANGRMPERFLEMRMKDIEEYEWKDCSVIISEEAKEAARRIIVIIDDREYARKLRSFERVHYWLYTDASEYAIGGHMPKRPRQEEQRWSEYLPLELFATSSFMRETFALKKMIKSLIHTIKSTQRTDWLNLIVYTDNKGLSHRWEVGTSNTMTNIWLLEIADMIVKNRILLEVMFIPREENKTADHLSKPITELVQPYVPQEIFDIWYGDISSSPKPNLDWFASETNHKLDTYCVKSWTQNAFTMLLTPNHIVYAFPPSVLYKKAIRAWWESESLHLYVLIPDLYSTPWKELRRKAVKEWTILVEGPVAPEWKFKIIYLSKLEL